MAFVTCQQFKDSQTTQDEALSAFKTSVESAQTKQDDRLTAVEACCENNTATNTSQAAEIEALKTRANQTTTAVSELGDSVVKKAEMGKGLTYNATNAQYEVNVQEANGVKVNEDGSVGLAVSEDEGNLLELRGDGVYYGTTAEQSDFYVDSINGSDSSGDGTESNPYQTLHKAFSQVKSQYRYTIHLQENGSYEWNSANYQMAASLTLEPYGRRWAAARTGLTSAGYGADHAAMCSAVVRPVLRLVAGKTLTIDGVTYATARNANLTGSQVLTLRALHLVAEEPSQPISQYSAGAFDAQTNNEGTVLTYGCDFTLASSVYVVSNMGTQMHYNARLVNEGKFIKLSSYFLNNINFVFDGNLNGTVIGESGYLYRKNASLETALVAKVDNKLGVLTANIQTTTAGFSA